ncbi:MAG: hypothetical protein M1814_001246 [Vezdaea aestivalis]|nr:MAG: hypothetical protein M1814_001246 [Vezdaea aestivalis]
MVPVGAIDAEEAASGVDLERVDVARVVGLVVKAELLATDEIEDMLDALLSIPALEVVDGEAKFLDVEIVADVVTSTNDCEVEEERRPSVKKGNAGGELFGPSADPGTTAVETEAEYVVVEVSPSRVTTDPAIVVNSVLTLVKVEMLEIADSTFDAGGREETS